jgi:hypothetical protein
MCFHYLLFSIMLQCGSKTGGPSRFHPCSYVLIKDFSTIMPGPVASTFDSEHLRS